MPYIQNAVNWKQESDVQERNILVTYKKAGTLSYSAQIYGNLEVFKN